MMLRGTTVEEQKNRRKLANTLTEHLLAQSFLEEDATWPPPEGDIVNHLDPFNTLKYL